MLYTSETLLSATLSVEITGLTEPMALRIRELAALFVKETAEDLQKLSRRRGLKGAITGDIVNEWVDDGGGNGNLPDAQEERELLAGFRQLQDLGLQGEDCRIYERAHLIAFEYKLECTALPDSFPSTYSRDARLRLEGLLQSYIGYLSLLVSVATAELEPKVQGRLGYRNISFL